jgi:hypothetical protein
LFYAAKHLSVAAKHLSVSDLVPAARWQAAVEDGRHFLARGADRAEALGWTPRDLFGLMPVPGQRPARLET